MAIFNSYVSLPEGSPVLILSGEDHPGNPGSPPPISWEWMERLSGIFHILSRQIWLRQRCQHGICWHYTCLNLSSRMSFRAADASWIWKRAGFVKRTSQELQPFSVQIMRLNAWDRSRESHRVSSPHVAKTCKNYCPQQHYVRSPPHDFCSIHWCFNILSAYVCCCLSEPQPLPRSSQLLRNHALLPTPKAYGMPLWKSLCCGSKTSATAAHYQLSAGRSGP